MALGNSVKENMKMTIRREGGDWTAEFKMTWFMFCHDSASRTHKRQART